MIRIGLALFAAVALPAAALAFPGGQTFSGKVKCTEIYNDGTAGPISSKDEVTLAFSAVETMQTTQTGTASLSHTNTSVGGVYLGASFTYAAHVNTLDSLGGMLVVTGVTGPEVTEGGIAEFKARSDGSVPALRFVFHHFDSNPSRIQRCNGTLKAQ